MSKSDGGGKTSASRTRYQRQDYLAALRQAWTLVSENAEGLTEQSYSELLASGTLEGPSAVRVIQVFKTWSGALAAAGVPALSPSRGYHSTWTYDELLRLMAEYLKDPGTTGSYAGWAEWKRVARPDAPSAQTLRNRLGSWSQAKGAALEAFESGDD
jgi:hypothetical protein